MTIKIWRYFNAYSNKDTTYLDTVVRQRLQLSFCFCLFYFVLFLCFVCFCLFFAFIIIRLLFVFAFIIIRFFMCSLDELLDYLVVCKETEMVRISTAQMIDNKTWIWPENVAGSYLIFSIFIFHLSFYPSAWSCSHKKYFDTQHFTNQSTS